MTAMEQVPHYRCYLGAAGWEHEGWSGGFYPDDLPPEWRLAFYSTAFRCVYLPYAEWGGRDPAALAAWVEDTPLGFRFVLEANPAGATVADAARLAVLAPRLARPAEVEGPLWLEDWPDLKRLAAELAGRGRPVFLISRAGDLAALERVKTLLELLGM